MGRTWPAVLAACVLAGGCGTNIRAIGKRPALTPVGAGLVTAQPEITVGRRRPDQRHGAGSLWRTNAIDLFRDPRARRAGDSLTVTISIKDKASIDSTSNRSRTANSDFNTGFDYEIGVKSVSRSGNGALNLNTGSTSKHNGQGATSRSETIDLRVAAVVTDTLPNGNLLIRGTQEVRVNYEVRVLTVAGIVRPRDVAPDNTIAYDKVAEARISYGGRGRISEVQQPNWGQQFWDMFAPY